MTTAQMAREVFDTPWVKLEVIGEEDTLQPDVFGLVEAASILTREGFQVFPYTTEDLVAAEKLLGAGCEVLMPWGSPIGSGRGLNNPYAFEIFARAFPECATDHRCRDRRAFACGGGDGTGVRRGAHQHSDRQGGRSCAIWRVPLRLRSRRGGIGYRADLMQARDMAAPRPR